MVEKTEHDSHSLSMDYMQSLPPREHRGIRRKRKKIYTGEKYTTSARWPRSTWWPPTCQVTQLSVHGYQVGRMACYFCLLLSNHTTPFWSLGKIFITIPTKGLSVWSEWYSLKPSRSSKTRYLSQEDPRETWYLNVTRCPEWYPKTQY